MLDSRRMIGAIAREPACTVVVFGDYCLDKYLYTDPANDELSVETGLVARQFDRKAIFAGVGGTITNNLRALGVGVRCVGMLGSDGERWELERALRETGADTRFMLETPGRCTCTYTKPMQKNPDGGYSETGRLDFRSLTPLPRAYEDALVGRLEEALTGADAVIITDQFVERGLGALTDRVRAAVCAMAEANPEKLFYADSRAFAGEYRHVIVKCNHLELLHICAPGFSGEPGQAFLEECGRELSARTGRPAFVTMGDKGSLVFANGAVTAVPAFHVEGPVDIVGAGDATNAGIVLGFCLGFSAPEAAALGNCVSSITIQQIGRTGTATRARVAERLRTCLEQ